MDKYLSMNAPVGGGNVLSSIMNMGNGISSTTWMIIGVVAIFVVVAVWYYVYYLSPNSTTKYHPNNELASMGDGRSAELLFFFADWCPHCKAAKPIWNDLKAKYETQTVNGHRIIFTEIDCSQDSPEVEKMVNQYNVEGYPTIKLIRDGQVIEYDAKVTDETLTKFLQTVLPRT